MLAEINNEPYVDCYFKHVIRTATDFACS